MAEQSSRISHSYTSPYNAANLEKDSHDGQQLPDQQQKETTEAEKNTENAKKRKKMPRREIPVNNEENEELLANLEDGNYANKILLDMCFPFCSYLHSLAYSIYFSDTSRIVWSERC